MNNSMLTDLYYFGGYVISIMAGKFPAACGFPLSMVSGISIPRPLGRGSL